LALCSPSRAISLLWSTGKMKFDAAGRSSRIGQRALFQQDQVGPAEAGQMADETVTDNAGTDHDDIGTSRKITHPVVLLRHGPGRLDHEGGSDRGRLMGCPTAVAARRRKRTYPLSMMLTIGRR